MNASQIAQVANFLSVSPNQIKRCEEWVHVLLVVVHGCRPRFVSKKVVKTMPKIKPINLLGMPDSWLETEKQQDEAADRARNLAFEINSHLSIDVPFNKLLSAAIEILEGATTFDAVVARFSSKKIVKRSK